MLAWAKDFTENTKLRLNKVHKFQTKQNIFIETSSYILKTAENNLELRAAFKLRHEVFFQEFQGISSSGLDYDRFDAHFDHLIIISKETKQLIGTYRLSVITRPENSYTALEFDLQKLFLLNGPFIELGRACIHKDFRRGAIISLLWRGIAEYMNITGANILYGCSSVKVTDPRKAALILKSFIDAGQASYLPFIMPTKKFLMTDFELWHGFYAKGLNEEQKNEAETLIPSLLSSYLKMGTKVAAEPAFDKEFQCIDFLTIIKKSDLALTLARRFQIAR